MLVCAAILAACDAPIIGDDGDDDSSADETMAEETASDEDAVTEVATDLFVSTDPEVCTEKVTPELVDHLTVGEGEEAIERCEENQANSPAESVEVTDITVDGDTAEAAVTPTGGSIGGIELRLGFVNDGGWKADEVISAEILDIDEFLAGQEADLADSETVPPSVERCILQSIGELDESVIERSIVEEGGEPTYVVDALVECLGGGNLRRAVIQLIVAGAVEGGAPPTVASCAANNVTADLSQAELRSILGGETDPEDLADEGRAAVQECPGGPSAPAPGGGEAPEPDPSPTPPSGGGTGTGDFSEYLDCVAAAGEDSSAVERCTEDYTGG